MSLAQRHLACIRYEVTVLWKPPTHLVIVVRARHAAGDHAAEVGSTRGGPGRWTAEACTPRASASRAPVSIRTYRTAASGLAVAAAMDHDVRRAHAPGVETHLDGDRAHVVFAVEPLRARRSR